MYSQGCPSHPDQPHSSGQQCVGQHSPRTLESRARPSPPAPTLLTHPIVSSPPDPHLTEVLSVPLCWSLRWVTCPTEARAHDSVLSLSSHSRHAARTVCGTRLVALLVSSAEAHGWWGRAPLHLDEARPTLSKASQWTQWCGDTEVCGIGPAQETRAITSRLVSPSS